MTPLQQLDPRRHPAATVGWAVFALVSAAAAAAARAATRAEDSAKADAQVLLSALAAQAGDRMAAQLATRRSIVQTTAIQIVASADRGDAGVRRHLEAVRQQFPEFLWLGLSDSSGRITAATERQARVVGVGRCGGGTPGIGDKLASGGVWARDEVAKAFYSVGHALDDIGHEIGVRHKAAPFDVAHDAAH